MFWLKMEDLEHSFQSSTIQKMELMLLQALKWRLGSTTTYSYIELITSNIIYLKCYLQKELINQVNKTLLKAILGTICIPSFLCFFPIWTMHLIVFYLMLSFKVNLMN